MPEAEATEKPSTPEDLRKKIETRVKESPVTSPSVQAFVDYTERAGRLKPNVNDPEYRTEILEKAIVEQRIVERMTSVKGYLEEYHRTGFEFQELVDAYAQEKQGPDESKKRATDVLLDIRNDVLVPHNPPKI